MKNIYLASAILGAITPWIFFGHFVLNEGVELVTFIEMSFTNSAASGIGADLLISSFVFWSYLIMKKESGIWLYVLVNLSIWLFCTCPVISI
tara:strand:+ start:1041 stop:1316 length:276 start_codon:yes stop_codon:yes gene_type:complete